MPRRGKKLEVCAESRWAQLSHHYHGTPSGTFGVRFGKDESMAVGLGDWSRELGRKEPPCTEAFLRACVVREQG